MNTYNMTMCGGALTALTALTKRDQKSSFQPGGGATSGVGHSIDIYALTEEERLAAEQVFQFMCNREADMVALLDEWLSESRDRSNWILPRPGELRRYELLDAYWLRHQPWLDYLDFAELIAAAQVAKMAWLQAPQDLILLDQYLTLSGMVLECLSPTCAETGVLRCSTLPVHVNSHTLTFERGGRE